MRQDGRIAFPTTMPIAIDFDPLDGSTGLVIGIAVLAEAIGDQPDGPFAQRRRFVAGQCDDAIKLFFVDDSSLQTETLKPQRLEFPSRTSFNLGFGGYNHGNSIIETRRVPWLRFNTTCVIRC